MQWNAATEAQDVDGHLQFYSAGPNGFVYRHGGVDSDDGLPIRAFWKSKAFYFPDIPHQKVLRYIKAFLEPKGPWNVTAEVLRDFQGTGIQRDIPLKKGSSLWGTMIWGKDPWGGGRTLIIDGFGIDKAFEFVQIKFENLNANEPFTLLGFTLDVDETRRP
jgi:hypothetical protein